ncbi:MAG: tetratricopeptide repeat protein, partial [Terriglobia bacterium]
SYFSLLEAVEAKKSVSLDEKTLRQRIVSSLQTFWKNNAAFEKSNPEQTKQLTFRDNRGKAAFMQTVILSKDTEANAAQIATVLQDFEQKYPEQKKVFPTIARMRLVVLQKTARFPELEGAVNKVFADYKPEQQQEILAGLEPVLQRDIKKLDQQKDQDTRLAAKRTLARLHADQMERKAFAEDQSPDQFKYELAQLYLDVKDYDKAIPLYQDLRQGAYSLAAIAGLAQIAATQGDRKQALSLWEEMLKETQAGDPLWFRGSYEVAYLNATLGNTDLACRTVNSTKPLLNRLGDQGLKKKIQGLTQRCSN